MMSKSKLNKKSGENSGTGKLFNEIGIITKALYEDRTHPGSSIPTSFNRSKSLVKHQFPEPKSKSKVNSNEDQFLKDKKSIWSWKSLKSSTHIRNKRFNCRFSLQVHSIEGLPPSFDGVAVCVKWRRRDGELTTRPATVSHGSVEFEETLTNTCSVYGSRSGPHHSAKYEAKHFLLYASVVNDPNLDLGKHRVDLTRILPLTLEELDEEKSSGKWTTSYRLSGKAKGADMNISFGYSVVGNSPIGPTRHSSTVLVNPSGKESGHVNRQSPIKQGSSSRPVRSRASSRSVEDIKDLHEVVPVSVSKSELQESVNTLYRKLSEDTVVSVDCDVRTVPLEPTKPDSCSLGPDKGDVGSEYFVLDQGVEPVDGSESRNDGLVPVNYDVKEQDFGGNGGESLLKDLESAMSRAIDTTKDGSDSQEENESFKEVESGRERALGGVEDVTCSNDSGFQDGESGHSEGEKHMKLESYYKAAQSGKGKSLSLDYTTEAVAGDFLDMLGLEHGPLGLSSESEPDSPRERLLRQFEKDALANGSSLFDFGVDGSDDKTDPSSSNFEETGKFDLPKGQSKTKAAVLEDLETETLMREWGVSENAFQCSPLHGPGPVDPSPDGLLELPPLGDGLGPFVQTSNGGFLRSMSPEIFRNAKSGGSLIMQVSSPVVVPAEMGAGVMDILQCLASVGIEKLSMQANKVMPLEDISGKTMQQIAWEAAAPGLEGPERQASARQEPEIGEIEPGDRTKVKRQTYPRKSTRFDSSSSVNDKDPEYVSLEDLAPLAMNKIEALSMEGLRIQSGMSEEDAPSNISPQSIGEMSAFEGKKVNSGGSFGLEGTGGLQLLNVEESSGNGGGGGDVDGIMGLSVTLDEWMRLDSGEIDDGDELSERTSRILAAHHASDMMRARAGGKRRGKGGLLGNNFTVALMVQLRDPLRNFEPVGTPMLALVQVERVFVPPKPKIYTTVRMSSGKPDDEDDEKPVEKAVKPEDEAGPEPVSVAQFKITEVHVAGLKTEPTTKKKLWGANTQQQQAGSRWLLANGMGKKNAKHPLMKSKPATGKSSSDGLWSVSSRPGQASRPVRNANVIIPNETVKLLSGAGFV